MNSEAYTVYQRTLAERNRQIAEMYAAGMNMEELAHEFMVSTSAVSLAIRKSGTAIRTRCNSVRWAVRS